MEIKIGSVSSAWNYSPVHCSRTPLNSPALPFNSAASRISTKWPSQYLFAIQMFVQQFKRMGVLMAESPPSLPNNQVHSLGFHAYSPFTGAHTVQMLIHNQINSHHWRRNHHFLSTLGEWEHVFLYFFPRCSEYAFTPSISGHYSYTGNFCLWCWHKAFRQYFRLHMNLNWLMNQSFHLLSAP